MTFEMLSPSNRPYTDEQIAVIAAAIDLFHGGMDTREAYSCYKIIVDYVRSQASDAPGAESEEEVYGTTKSS